MTQTPWGIWTRAWTAEENRHGDLMNKYAYLSGRVDMRVRPCSPCQLYRSTSTIWLAS